MTDFVAPPEGRTFSDQLVQRFEPWLTADLQQYLEAIATMFDQIVLLAYDTDTEAGWTILFDPDRCPDYALPYLAQYVGEVLPAGIAEADAREWIKDAPNQRRGTPRSVFLAAQRHLTGSRTVAMIERPGGVVDSVQIRTYVSNTPDAVQTKKDILSVLPADVLLDYATTTGNTWNDVKAAYPTWTALKATGKTWATVSSTLSGYTLFPRPKP
jgi:hypothetical protein